MNPLRLVRRRDRRGIYLDDCTSNCFVYGNLIVRAGMGFQIHGGKHNVIENNIIVDCKVGVHCCDHPPLRPGNAHIRGMFRGNEFVRNIISSCHPDARLYTFQASAYTDDIFSRCDHNVVWQSSEPKWYVSWHSHPDASTNSTFEEWRDLGFDRHSIVANPEFLNPETLGFPLSPDSPARKLGFSEIDTSRIGIREDAPTMEVPEGVFEEEACLLRRPENVGLANAFSRGQ